MLSMPHLSLLQWNYKDELISAGNGTFTSYYSYDNEGNRTRKVVVKGNITETRYYIGGYEVFRKEVNQTLDTERTTLNIADDKKVFVRVEQKTGENEIVRYQYDNHLGSACLELDEQGQIISYEEYHPFGTTSYRSGRSETEVSLKRYKYNGKERDEETGLYAYGMRYYATWLCRFVSVDPLQFKYPELTPFQYSSNNPVTMIDLDGAEGVKPDDKVNVVHIDSNGATWNYSYSKESGLVGQGGVMPTLKEITVNANSTPSSVQGNNTLYNFTDTGIKSFAMPSDPSGGLGIYTQQPQAIQLEKTQPFTQQKLPNTGEIRPGKTDFERIRDEMYASTGIFENWIRFDLIPKSTAIGCLAVGTGLAAVSAGASIGIAANAAAPGIYSTATNAYNAAAMFYGTTTGQVVTGIVGGYVLNKMDAGPDVTLPDPISNTIYQGVDLIFKIHANQLNQSDTIQKNNKTNIK
jgi:RHS repeat-associated protein